MDIFFVEEGDLLAAFWLYGTVFFLVHMTPSNFWEKEKTDVRVCQTVIHIIYNHHFTLVAKSRCKLRKTDIFILRWWRAHLCESRHLKRNAPGLKDLFLPRTTYKVLWGDVPRLIVSIHLWWEIHRVSSSLFVGYLLEIVFLSPQKRRHTCKV